MVKPEHLASIEQGVAVWNDWKKQQTQLPIDLRGANFRELDLSGIDLSQSELERAIFSDANLSHANLTGANLHRAVLYRTNLTKADLSWTDLREVDFRSADLKGALLRGANLYEAVFRGANLRNANLRGANLRAADLRQVNLSQVNLSQANLSQANLSEEDLRRVNLSQANLSQSNLRGAYLSQTNLQEADLSGAYLGRAFLMGADLRNADLRGAFFKDAVLRRANLSGANLAQVNLSGADVSQADLSEAALIAVQGFKTNFTQAIFTGACIQDWQIDSGTRLENIICDYVYLQAEEQERYPQHKDFVSGEFTHLFGQVQGHLEFVFSNGIEWQAFAIAFHHLQKNYGFEEVWLQAFEVRLDGSFVVRVSMASGFESIAITEEFYRDYHQAVATIDLQYSEQFQISEERLAATRRKNIDLFYLAQLAARSPIQRSSP
jgi:uncharacterized protein YjbI with pentapeptide repeats